LERHEKSRARAAHWKNTIAGQHRQTMQDRTERLAKREQDNRNADLQFQKNKEQERQDIIRRAKKLQFMETDMVKQFHSKLNLIHAIEERDLQLQQKRDTKSAVEKEQGNKLYPNVGQDQKFNEKQRLDAKLVSIRLARDNIDQAKQRKLNEIEEKKVIAIDIEGL
jgi:hypothetical protein